jgi:hypothetical protein
MLETERQCWTRAVDACGTISRFSYTQIIDVPSAEEEAPLQASGFHGAAGCVTSSLFITWPFLPKERLKKLFAATISVRAIMQVRLIKLTD